MNNPKRIDLQPMKELKLAGTIPLVPAVSLDDAPC